MSRALTSLFAAAFVALFAIAACGGRSPLASSDLYEEPVGNGGAGAAGATGGTGATSTGGTGVGASGAGGTGPGGTGPGGTGPGGTGPGGSGGGSMMDCMTCVLQSCPTAMDCLTDPNCLNGLMCAVGQCMSGGQPDIMCMLECFNGDIGAAMQAFEAIMCIFQDCADECGGQLPF